ncbi:hypothetical protein, partial [Methylobacterium iners]
PLHPHPGKRSLDFAQPSFGLSGVGVLSHPEGDMEHLLDPTFFENGNQAVETREPILRYHPPAF